MHVGAFGPLAFRKDFNLNIQNNVAGWYRRYLFQANLLPGGIANAIAGHIFDCGPDQQANLNQLFWQSDYVHIGVARYRVELVTTINPDGKTYTNEGGLFVLNQGIIWHWQYVVATLGRPGFNVEGIPHTDFWSADWWDSEPQGRSIFTRAKFWSDGPPD